MVVNCLPDFVGLALLSSVKAADDALQFRELLDQFSGEIALAQLRGADSGVIAMQFLHQRNHALGFL